MKKLSIIVPVFNEEKTISKVLQNLKKLKISNWSIEIIIVDDGSKDKSKFLITNFLKKVSKSKNFKYLIHKMNQGKGKAIKNGLKVAKGDLCIVQDADLEYSVIDIKKLIKVYEKKGGVTLGSRNLNPKRQGYMHYVFGVWFLTELTNILFKTNLTDTYTCYKLMETKLVKSLRLESSGFEIEMEIIAKSLKKGIQINEVPISYNPRTFSEGKKIGWRDGLRGLIVLLQVRYIP